MKKLLLTFMVLTFCLSSCIIAFADNNINTESGSIIEAPDLRFLRQAAENLYIATMKKV